MGQGLHARQEDRREGQGGCAGRDGREGQDGRYGRDGRYGSGGRAGFLSSGRGPIVIGAVTVFLLALVFFTKVCPLVPSDADDWYNLGKVRSGLPEWGGFNPSKVFPEVLMPLTGYVAGFILMPFTKSFITALALATGLLVSLVIAVYVGLFGRLLQRKAHADALTTVCLMLVFYFFHLIFLSHTAGRGTVPFLFGTLDFTGYFHYILPALWGASVCMWIELRGPSLSVRGASAAYVTSTALLVLAIYAAMFTHILENIVLAAYAGASLVAALPAVRRRVTDWDGHPTVRDYVAQNGAHFLVLAFWLVTLAFEVSGGRASGTMGGGAGLHVGAVLADLLVTLSYLNRKLVLLLLVGFVGALVAQARGMRAGGAQGGSGIQGGSGAQGGSGTQGTSFRDLMVVVIQVLLMLAFVILLSSVMDPYTQTIQPSHYYASRTDVLVVVLFPCIAFGLLCLARCLGRVGALKLLAPTLVVVMFLGAMSHVGNYSEPVKGSMTGASAIRVQDYLVQQVIDADQAGQETVEVHVPVFQNSFAYNWPMAPFAGDGMGRALHVFGVTSRQLNTVIVPDQAVNERFDVHAPAV